MMKRSHSAGSTVLLLFAIFTAVTALVTWRLFPIPFGALFDAFGYLMLLGLIGSLATLAVLWLRHRHVALRALGIVSAILALAVALLTAALMIDYTLIPGTAYREGLTAEQWTEDLRYLAAQMPRVHPRLYELIARERFEAAVAELEREIPRLDENRIRWGIYRIAALPNDAHTYMNIFVNKLDWHMIPLKLWLFPEGLYVLDAGREEKDLVGTRIVAIEQTPVEEAYRLLRPYLPAENEHHWQERFTYLIICAEALRAAGICPDEGPIDMTFEDLNGQRFTRAVKAYHYLPVIYWAGMRRVDNDVPYVFWNDRRDAYWFEYRKDTRTLYVQFNQCDGESREETVEQFVERLGAWVEANEFERCVLDIRKNGGGDSRVSRMIAGLAIGNPRLDRPGRLFVLTSRKTFSAAVMFLSLMECGTGAVIVGEPTGQGPFFSARSQPVALPNSGIEISVSRYHNECALIDDGRNAIEPDVYVEYTHDGYLAGRDPAMEKVLAYEPPVVATAGLEPGAVDRLSGRYLFSPYQLLTVEWEDDGLLLCVDDFFEGSFRNVRTRLHPVGGGRFLADIAGVEAVFDGSFGPSPGVTLDWRGIRTYAVRIPAEHRLPMELFAEGRIDEALAGIRGEKGLYANAIPGFEATINATGYRLLRDGEHDDAIAVFALNVELFPESANTYDSLGEAYMRSGQNELAIRNYEKSLDLNPRNANAKRVLERLRKGA